MIADLSAIFHDNRHNLCRLTPHGKLLVFKPDELKLNMVTAAAASTPIAAPAVPRA
jgi:hypothetical protein